MASKRLSRAEMLSILAAHASGEDRDLPAPDGWYTLSDIRKELGLSYNRNASTRAYEIFMRGGAERKLHRSRVKSGHCHMSYIYKPKPPFKTMIEAAFDSRNLPSEEVPSGWVRPIEYAKMTDRSIVAVRSIIARYSIAGRTFRTRRGLSGLHHNKYYKKADLDRVYKVGAKAKKSR